ncbi:hypothetical protein FNQ90_07120 [Streptomyces alkaliphilus]|uniref:Helix-turn-helix domain-containing protein n=1 Tax=Streptomyces alkaliphilus TaxID=1472722 RepID=A0A7W3Y0W6_9ACTN|nr:hypothetical protein [Streptomyces alkaliphilus]MBB0243883.1 hypothetical protein [Streptomyces alkaliphilus]
MSARRPSAVAYTAGVVVLPASVAYPLWVILRRELARHRDGGGRLRPDMADALDALRAAAHHHAMTANGHPARTPDPDPAPSRHELLTTDQLAELLGVTARHARRLAAASGIEPAARGAWHPDDAHHLTRTRQEAA